MSRNRTATIGVLGALAAAGLGYLALRSKNKGGCKKAAACATGSESKGETKREQGDALLLDAPAPACQLTRRLQEPPTR